MVPELRQNRLKKLEKVIQLAVKLYRMLEFQVILPTVRLGVSSHGLSPELIK